MGEGEGSGWGEGCCGRAGATARLYVRDEGWGEGPAPSRTRSPAAPAAPCRSSRAPSRSSPLSAAAATCTHAARATHAGHGCGGSAHALHGETTREGVGAALGATVATRTCQHAAPHKRGGGDDGGHRGRLRHRNAAVLSRGGSDDGDEEEADAVVEEHQARSGDVDSVDGEQVSLPQPLRARCARMTTARG